MYNNKYNSNIITLYSYNKYNIVHGFLIHNLLSIKKERVSAIGGSRASQRERNRSDKKKKNRKKENVILCGNLPHGGPLTPYVCNY